MYRSYCLTRMAESALLQFLEELVQLIEFIFSQADGSILACPFLLGLLGIVIV